MRSDYSADLDACVLLPMPLADTLLRMAEEPRLYLPKWGRETLNEVSRNLMHSFGRTREQASRRENAMTLAFPEALVEGCIDLVPAMCNDEKDRHVLASAVASGTKLIVTFNRKHFPKECLEHYDIECQGPSTFLIGLYDLDPGIVVQKLSEQAQAVGITLDDLLKKLFVSVPNFVTFFCEEQKIDFP